MFFKKKVSSIAVYFILALVIVTTIILAVYGMVQFKDKETDLNENLKLKQELYAEQLAIGLSLPLWNYDLNQVSKICESIAKDKEIVGVCVLDMKGEKPVITTKNLEEQNIVNGQNKLPEHYLIKEKLISYTNEPLGIVRIYTSLSIQKARKCLY